MVPPEIPIRETQTPRFRSSLGKIFRKTMQENGRFPARRGILHLAEITCAPKKAAREITFLANIHRVIRKKYAS